MLRKCYFRPRKLVFGSNFVVFAQILVCRVGDIKYDCVGSKFLAQILVCRVG
jgi:hypothetical protein